MAIKVKINSVDVTSQVNLGTIQIALRQNERGTAFFSLLPEFTCASFDHVEIFELNGTTRKFDGVVFPGPTTRGIEEGAIKYYDDVACVDYVAYVDWATWSHTYTAPYTIQDLLNDAVSESLGAFGISVDGAQDPGDTFAASADAPIVIDEAHVMEVLRSHMDACDPPRVLRMSQATRAIRAMTPGQDTAPFTIDSTNPNYKSFESSYPDYTPATRVSVRGGQTGEWELTQTFTADGIATSWPIGTRVSRLPGTPTPDVPDPRIKISVNAGALDWVGVVGTPWSNNFDINYSTGPGVKDYLTAAGYGTPPAGTTLAITFAVQGPFEVEAVTGSPPYLSQPFTMEDQLPNIEPYLLRAQNELDKLQGAARQLTIKQLGEPGTPSAQVLTSQKIPSVVVTSRSFTNDIVITQLDFSLTEQQMVSDRFFTSGKTYAWETIISAVETLKKHFTVYDQVRQLLKGAGGGGSFALSTGGGGGGGTTPGVTLSCLALGAKGGSEACTGITWTDPAAPGATVGPYPDDPLSAEAREIPGAYTVMRGNTDGPPFPIIQFLPFSCKLVSDQTGFIKIGIVDLDSDYGRANYIYSYVLPVTAGVPVFKAGIFAPLSSSGLVLQNDHRYVVKFEGSHPGADTGIDGATIFIDDVYTLVWMGSTSVQQQPAPTELLPAGTLLLPELRETSPNAMVAINWAGTQLMPSPTIAFTAYYIGAMRSLNGGGYMIQHSPGSGYVMKFLDVNLAIVGTYSGLTSTAKIGLSSNFVDAFYALDRTTMILRKFDPTGSVLQSWTLSATGLYSGSPKPETALAVSPDGSTAYYSENGFQKIKMADLTGGSTPADATFADESASDAGSGGLGVGADALVILRDGKILAYWRGYEPAGVYTNEKNIIRIYNPNGTTYATYTIGFNSAYYGGGYYVVGIAANGSDSSSFLAVEADDDNNQGRVREYRVSDGAVLNTRLLADGALDPNDFLNGTGVLQMPVGANPVAAVW